MKNEEWIEPLRQKARSEGLERTIQPLPQAGGKIVMEGRSVLNFSSNDYLDLSHHPVLRAGAQSALDQYGTGATASRLVTGTLPIHEELEKALAQFKGYPAALLFGSGFLTNVGVIPSLVGRGDHIFADRLIHASMIDAAHLSRAKIHRFHHNDMAHLEDTLKKNPRGKRLILAESIYSMDGDLAPIEQMAGLAETHGAMIMVDEAHAMGTFGPNGGGRVRQHGLESRVNLAMGTLSKALGGYGGFVACSDALRLLLINKARSFIYTTALPPASIGAALGALKVLHDEPDLGLNLQENATVFRNKLKAAGLDTLDSASQIIPIVIGGNRETLEAAQRLRRENILAIPIRPPTVPDGSARLRLSVTLAHTPADLEQAAKVIIQVLNETG